MNSNIKRNPSWYYSKNNLIGYSFIASYILLTFLSLYFIVETQSWIIRILFILLLWFLQAWYNQWKHEFLHNTVINNSCMNTLFWYYFSLAIGVNPHLNKDFHLWHHKYIGTTNDPELDFDVRKDYQLHTVLLRKLYRPFLFDIFYANFSILLLKRYPKYAKDFSSIRKDSFLLFSFHILLITFSVFFLSWEYILYWYVILEYVGFNILCIYDIAEHRWCKTHIPNKSSRTCYSNPFIWYMTWFNNFHSVHHLDTPEQCVAFSKRRQYFLDKELHPVSIHETWYFSFIIDMYKNPKNYTNDYSS